MIIKELDSFSSADPILKAGRAAEEQMAFYLRRAFKDDEKLLVFNGLRYEHEDEVVQIDHLILHPQGLIILESKSVTGAVAINEHGEWTRYTGRTAKGMPSPIRQAERQSDLLREFLNAHSAQLRNKIVFGLLQTYINKHTPIDILVAISDDGIIKRPEKVNVSEVSKADEIPSRVRALYQKYRKAGSPLSLDYKNTGSGFSKDEMARISTFLVERHMPISHKTLIGSAVPPAVGRPETPYAAASTGSTESSYQPVRVAESKSNDTKTERPRKIACRHCHSLAVQVEFGRYGYYFKCRDCAGNTPIYNVCESCQQKLKIRKSGVQFYAECERCGKSQLFHTNSV